MGLRQRNVAPNPGQKNRPSNQKKKKKGICQIVDFAVPAGHRLKMKESEKKNKYLDLAWEWKKSMEHEGGNNTNRDWCSWYSQ